MIATGPPPLVVFSCGPFTIRIPEDIVIACTPEDTSGTTLPDDIPGSWDVQGGDEYLLGLVPPDGMPGGRPSPVMA